MKMTQMHAASIALLALVGWNQSTRADTAEVICEVRKDGDTRKGASGPCSFSQRQGYVSIGLRNGDRYELSPASQPDHFKDLKGNKVVRSAGGGTHTYKWEGGTIVIVTFDSGNSSAASAPGVDQREEFESVCGVIVNGQQYRYRCRVVDSFVGGRLSATTLHYPDQTIQLTWRSGDRVGLQFEGMVPMEARYARSEGETNFRFEDKTYFYISNRDAARFEIENFRD